MTRPKRGDESIMLMKQEPQLVRDCDTSEREDLNGGSVAGDPVKGIAPAPSSPGHRPTNLPPPAAQTRHAGPTFRFPWTLWVPPDLTVP